MERNIEESHEPALSRVPRRARTQKALRPLSFLYGGATFLRNKLFDKGWLRERAFPVKTICVGNLAVGGTGKTPHVEYLVRMLRHRFCVATLSRGYGRKTKGFLMAREGIAASDLGDEPLQMHRKYGSRVIVAVDENRCEGIARILQEAPKTDVILLDDAFQHRYVKAGFRLLLTAYDRLYAQDELLPAGRLREGRYAAARADVVLVTKCPSSLSLEEKKETEALLACEERQKVFFTQMAYGAPYSLKGAPGRNDFRGCHIVLIAGIAYPEALMKHCEEEGMVCHPCIFPDHHRFSSSDLTRVGRIYQRLPEGNRLVLTTEKDAARLMHFSVEKHPWLQEVWAQPIEVKFLFEQEKIFETEIFDYLYGAASRERGE